MAPKDRSSGIQTVTSLQNPKVKLAASLTQRKYRERLGLVLVEGDRLIAQSLDFGAAFQFFLVNEAHREAPVTNSAASCAPVLVVTDEIMRKVSDTRAPQGIVGVAQQVDEKDADLDSAQFVVVADRLQDPGNMGTLLRVATAAGVDHVIATEGSVDFRSPKVIRASAGTYFHGSLLGNREVRALSQALRDNGFRIVVADAAATVDLFTYDWTGRVALVVGNEGAGPDPRLEATDYVAIPMPGGGESLNVGVAAGVLIYEALRQRR